MHEITYALELIELLEKTAHEAGDAKVTCAKVQLGRGTGINPENLALAFNWATRDTVIENTRLDVELIPITVLCTLCDHVYTTEEILSECPHCGALGGKTLSGDEFRLDAVEMENVGVPIH